ncbi:transcription intermediary factor 1-alpha-like isoform X2 [Mytilus californianus]|uniref:transcription intermediary factor 1-alpha-like isoform X2 n=1 Tax=Mytilus californianus TaxID=6549 RepID=UPI0022458D37|nr:transcription intermediary factor 1-alpha-like isoform X2 [Mytilus californianus]XP_052067488.1 transcription intermediary factor 1-alpha-like isoform X2 [Mytilus californianus]
MASNTSVCFICDLRHETKSSTHWCPECEEALCSDCMEHHSLSKGTRRHKIIPISQYQSLSYFVRDLQQLCIYHNEKYKQYCMKHECLICYKCIKEHGKCNAVVPLEDVVSGVKTSKLLQDLETSLIDILENIKRIREDKEINIKFIQNEEITITLEIDSIKQQINQHLDTLKDDIMKELAKISHYHNDVVQTIVSSLKDQEKEITHFCMEIKNIKRYASDLQTFIGMRVVQSRVTENDRRLQSMIKNKSLENVIMQLTIDDKIKNILTFVNTFGKILIKKPSSDKTKWQSNKNKQALVSIPNKIQ